MPAMFIHPGDLGRTDDYFRGGRTDSAAKAVAHIVPPDCWSWLHITLTAEFGPRLLCRLETNVRNAYAAEKRFARWLVFDEFHMWPCDIGHPTVCLTYPLGFQNRVLSQS